VFTLHLCNFNRLKYIIFKLVVVTIFRYKAQIELEKSQKIIDEEETIVSSGKSYNLAL
jgi:hypothetical protein